MTDTHPQKKIITHMTPTDLQQLQTIFNDKIIIIKFSAKWCKPCKLIAPTCDEWVKTCPDNIIYADIDIDENTDLYSGFKNKKMVRGVPTLLAFDLSMDRDNWYIPDYSVEGGDINAVERFFNTHF